MQGSLIEGKKITYKLEQETNSKPKSETPLWISENLLLSESHYLKLIRTDNENERQYNFDLYERLVLILDKEKVKELSEK